jgi:type I restriction enzyme M protein
MVRADLDDFIACYRSGQRSKREESEKFKCFPLETLLARDNLDIFWVKDHALDDPDLLPSPDEVAAEIVESLETALDRFRNVANARMNVAGWHFRSWHKSEVIGGVLDVCS